MPELYDERRTEPRFPTSGEATFAAGGRAWSAEILDLSLNGAKISRPAGFDPPSAARLRVTLAVAGLAPFSAEMLVHHAEGAQLGLEFYDMPPQDFAVLVGAIEQFQRLRRRAAVGS
jgi:hypothetical protein